MGEMQIVYTVRTFTKETKMDMREKKIVEYRMLSEFTANSLSQKVNNWIEQGFQPYGQPFYSHNPDTRIDFLNQAMVRYRE